MYKSESSAIGKPELHGRAAGNPIPEISGEEMHELDEQRRIGEMEGRTVAPVEMPGDGYGRLSGNSRIRR